MIQDGCSFELRDSKILAGRSRRCFLSNVLRELFCVLKAGVSQSVLSISLLVLRALNFSMLARSVCAVDPLGGWETSFSPSVIASALPFLCIHFQSVASVFFWFSPEQSTADSIILPGNRSNQYCIGGDVL